MGDKLVRDKIPDIIREEASRYPRSHQCVTEVKKSRSGSYRDSTPF